MDSSEGSAEENLIARLKEKRLSSSTMRNSDNSCDKSIVSNTLIQ